jgi:hypothetical protein
MSTSSIPEQAPTGKTVTVVNIANSRTILSCDVLAPDKKSAKSHRLTLGRAADMGKEGEPDPSVVLKGEEVVLWWPTVRKFAVGSDEHPSRISVTVS